MAAKAAVAVVAATLLLAASGVSAAAIKVVEDDDRVLSSSVVTSVSVVMNEGAYLADPLGRPQPSKGASTSEVASPAAMARPDKFEFWAWAPDGGLRRQPLQPAQLLAAPSFYHSEPSSSMAADDVVASVGAVVEAARRRPPPPPPVTTSTISKPGVASWNNVIGWSSNDDSSSSTTEPKITTYRPSTSKPSILTTTTVRNGVQKKPNTTSPSPSTTERTTAEPTKLIEFPSSTTAETTITTSKEPSTITIKESSTSTFKEPSTPSFKEPSTPSFKEPSTSSFKEPSTTTIKESSTQSFKEPPTTTIKESSTLLTKESSTSPIKESSTSSDTETSTPSFKEPSTTTMKESSTTSTKESSASPIKESSTSSAKESSTSSAKESSTSSAKESSTSSAKESSTSSAKESSTSPTKESSTSSAKETSTPSFKEPSTTTIKESSTPSTKESSTSSIKESSISLIEESSTYFDDFSSSTTNEIKTIETHEISSTETSIVEDFNLNQETTLSNPSSTENTSFEDQGMSSETTIFLPSSTENILSEDLAMSSETSISVLMDHNNSTSANIASINPSKNENNEPELITTKNDLDQVINITASSKHPSISVEMLGDEPSDLGTSNKYIVPTTTIKMDSSELDLEKLTTENIYSETTATSSQNTVTTSEVTTTKNIMEEIKPELSEILSDDIISENSSEEIIIASNSQSSTWPKESYQSSTPYTQDTTIDINTSKTLLEFSEANENIFNGTPTPMENSNEQTTISSDITNDSVKSENSLSSSTEKTNGQLSSTIESTDENVTEVKLEDVISQTTIQNNPEEFTNSNDLKTENESTKKIILQTTEDSSLGITEHITTIVNKLSSLLYDSDDSISYTTTYSPIDIYIDSNNSTEKNTDLKFELSNDEISSTDSDIIIPTTNSVLIKEITLNTLEDNVIEAAESNLASVSNIESITSKYFETTNYIDTTSQKIETSTEVLVNATNNLMSNPSSQISGENDYTKEYDILSTVTPMKPISSEVEKDIVTESYNNSETDIYTTSPTYNISDIIETTTNENITSSEEALAEIQPWQFVPNDDFETNTNATKSIWEYINDLNSNEEKLENSTLIENPTDPLIDYIINSHTSEEKLDSTTVISISSEEISIENTNITEIPTTTKKSTYSSTEIYDSSSIGETSSSIEIKDWQLIETSTEKEINSLPTDPALAFINSNQLPATWSIIGNVSDSEVIHLTVSPPPIPESDALVNLNSSDNNKPTTIPQWELIEPIETTTTESEDSSSEKYQDLKKKLKITEEEEKSTESLEEVEYLSTTDITSTSVEDMEKNEEEENQSEEVFSTVNDLEDTPNTITSIEETTITYLVNEGENEATISNDESEATISNDESEASISNDKNEASISNNENEASISNDENEASISNDENEASISNNANEALISNDENEASISNDGNEPSITNEENESSITNNENESSLTNNEDESSLTNNENESSLTNNENESSLTNNEKESSITNDENESSITNNEDESSLTNNENESSLTNNENESSLTNNENESSLTNNENESSLTNNENESSITNNENESSITNNKNGALISNDENKTSNPNDEIGTSISKGENKSSTSKYETTTFTDLDDLKETNTMSQAELAVPTTLPPQSEIGLDYPGDAPAAAEETDAYKFAELCNELAWRIWRSLDVASNKNKSLVFSPFAATSQLALLFLGARGPTSGQMNNLLGLDDVHTFNPHAAFRETTNLITSAGTNQGVTRAAFVRQLYADKDQGRLLEFYKNQAQLFYQANVEELPASEWPNTLPNLLHAATKSSLSEQTEGSLSTLKIKEFLPLRPPLASFSASLLHGACGPFSTDGDDGVMYVPSTIESERRRRLMAIPALVLRSGFYVGRDEGIEATVVSLQSPESEVSTVLVTPWGDGSLQELESRLFGPDYRQGSWRRLLRSLKSRPDLELQIPRIHQSSEVNATSLLLQLGLRDLLDSSKADLRGLSTATATSRPLYLSDAVFLAEFEACSEDNPVLEPVFLRAKQLRAHELEPIPLRFKERTTVTPSTPIAIRRLRFDRPFIYVVRHNRSGFVLFIGRYYPA